MSSKISIALVSVLKPVNDTRFFEKFGLSFSQTNKYDVNIIGFAVKNIKKVQNVYFYPVFRFNRVSFARLLAPLVVYRYLLKVKPSVIIFNTPEILYVILLFKLLYRCQVIYDIQENYFRNIIYNKHHPRIIRWLLGPLIRAKEWSGYAFYNQVIFAEEGYRKELHNWDRKAVVIKNTYKNINDIDQTINQYAKKVTFLFSGTIAENYGIFKAVSFIENLFHIKPDVQLLIVGYCASRKVLKKLTRLIENKDYIHLIGGDHLIPHEDIIRYIQIADYGLICYEINPSIENCFPTKIYEYMANKLPIIIQNYKPWSSFCLKYDAAVEVDFDQVYYQELFAQLTSLTFYRKDLPQEIFWNQEEKKLLDMMDDLKL